MSFIWKDNFFFAKIGNFSKSITGPLFQRRSTVYPTQPYSFSGRIKLSICQIRYELRNTIHEISTNWKKCLMAYPIITNYILIIYELSNFYHVPGVVSQARVSGGKRTTSLVLVVQQTTRALLTYIKHKCERFLFQYCL